LFRSIQGWRGAKKRSPRGGESLSRLVGPKKSLKTNISLDLAFSLATGGRFLGYFNVPERRRMAVMSGESGTATIKETAQRVCYAAGQLLEHTDIIFSDNLPRFGDVRNLDAFQRFLQRDAIEVAIIAPAYLRSSSASGCSSTAAKPTSPDPACNACGSRPADRPGRTGRDGRPGTDRHLCGHQGQEPEARWGQAGQ
jgi:hypothetical protein